jgi:hypothetical protein
VANVICVGGLFSVFESDHVTTEDSARDCAAGWGFSGQVFSTMLLPRAETHVRFQILTAASMKLTIFWDVLYS